MSAEMPGAPDASSVPSGSGGVEGSSGRGRLVAFVLGAILATLLIVAGVLALLGQGSAAKSTPRNALVGQTLQGFTLPGINGDAVRSPWSEHHAAVLLFFAAWCGPCHTELPGVARTAGSGSIGAVRVIGIDGDRTPGVASRFVAASGVRFPVGHDASLALASQYVPAGFPAAIFVTSQGVVASVHYGVLSPAALLGGARGLD